MRREAVVAVLGLAMLAAPASAAEKSPRPPRPAAGADTASAAGGNGKDGVFVRLRLIEPRACRWYVRLGGYIHVRPWYLKGAVLPAGADKDKAARLRAGEWTGWFDLKAHAGKHLHGRMNRSGGIAELPNVTAEFFTDPPADRRKVVIELAARPDAEHVVKRFEERFTGWRTSFLVSPTLAADAASLESLSQMQARHLRWAREASGGRRVSPRRHIIQTSFYGPTIQGAEVLWLLGFNVVGNQTEEIHRKFPSLRRPGHTHRVLFGPAATQAQIDALMAKHAGRLNDRMDAGVPFGFSDEVVCRPRIGSDAAALRHFRQWLAERQIDPKSLGAAALADVVPIETPQALRERAEADASAAARVFYYTSRFRQAAATQRIRWHTEAFHKHFTADAMTSTLVADHPYFGGTGLGMGMVPNTTWGGAPLALDWFDVARRRAVDLIGIEDWMGLQYMYGPHATWEGFQLMGFQASIFRSAGRGRVPVIAWITPSDETNLRLKSASALCQGAKHFFYWTYGPTCFGTENYWSDLRGEYDGIARVVRQLAAAEHLLAPGRTRKTRLALLYSVSSDLWQPFGYIHMLERRATYLSLVHEQYLVDMLTEEDVEAGRLRDYDVLYVTDPCITAKAAAAVEQWVQRGGWLYGACGAGSRNEFDEPAVGLSRAFGVRPQVETKVQPGEYRVRGRLNGMEYMDEVRLDESVWPAAGRFGVLGVKASFRPAGAKVAGRFRDGSPAAAVHALGKGRAAYLAACPGLSYLKDAKFVPRALQEHYPPRHRRLINAAARAGGAARLVDLSRDVVEAGVYDAPAGTALVLANFTYQPIERLAVRLAVRGPVRSVRAAEAGAVDFAVQEPTPAERRQGFDAVAAFTMKLGLNDVVVLERGSNSKKP